MSRFRSLVESYTFATVFVFTLALAARLAFWAEIRGTPLDSWHEWDQTDMSTYLEQARQLREDDWLAAEPYRPYHNWQRVAPREKWLEWYGKGRFHQAPAYSYAIAAVGAALDDPLPWLKSVQLLAGAITCVLAAWLAAQLSGRGAFWVTGVLAALYGPLLYIETQVLREAFGVLGLLALSAALVRYADPKRWSADRGSGRVAGYAAGGIGVALGLYATFHEMASVAIIAAVFVIGGVPLLLRRHLPTAVVVVTVLGIGYVVGFAPLLARNIAVGVPPFAVSSRTIEAIVHANEADAPLGGSLFSPEGPGPNFVEILDESNGSVSAAIAGVWRSYDGDLALAARNAWLRFRTIWHRAEIPDNVNHAFFAQHSGVLGTLPDFALVFPLGIVGFAVSAFRALARDDVLMGARAVAWRESRHAHAVLILMLVGLTASLTLIHAVARYRLYLVPFFWIYAGVAVAAFDSVARARQPGRVVGLLAGVVLASVLQVAMSANGPGTRPRLSDYSFANRTALEQRDYDFSLELAEGAAVHYPRYGAYFADLALEHERAGRYDEALRYYERSFAMQPRLKGLRKALARVRENARSN